MRSRGIGFIGPGADGPEPEGVDGPVGAPELAMFDGPDLPAPAVVEVVEPLDPTVLEPLVAVVGPFVDDDVAELPVSAVVLGPLVDDDVDPPLVAVPCVVAWPKVVSSSYTVSVQPLPQDSVCSCECEVPPGVRSSVDQALSTPVESSLSEVVVVAPVVAVVVVLVVVEVVAVVAVVAVVVAVVVVAVAVVVDESSPSSSCGTQWLHSKLS